MSAFRGQFAYRSPAQQAADNDRRKYSTRAEAKRAQATKRREKSHPSLSPAEKKARRLEHAERVRDALSALETPEGYRAWLEARELNPTLTPLAQALTALQAPGQCVGTAAQWRRSGFRITRGETAALYLTAPGFWPLAAFTAAQTDAPDDLADPDPPAVALAELRRWQLAALRALFAADGRKTATLNSFAETLAEDPPAETERAPEAREVSDGIPF